MIRLAVDMLVTFPERAESHASSTKSAHNVIRSEVLVDVEMTSPWVYDMDVQSALHQSLSTDVSLWSIRSTLPSAHLHDHDFSIYDPTSIALDDPATMQYNPIKCSTVFTLGVSNQSSYFSDRNSLPLWIMSSLCERRGEGRDLPDPSV